ncbi:MAG: NifU family protein [Candidatus Pelagibacter sp.]
MFIQTQETPNPNSLKFIPGKKVSNIGSIELMKKEDTNNNLLRNILSVNGVESIFLGDDFLSVNKNEKINWEDIKHIVISLINEFYSDGKDVILDKVLVSDEKKDFKEIEEKIIKILETKIKPAVARDGGDIKFVEFKNGIVKVQLQGSCSGCPSSTITLKRGVQNLLTHYIPDVKQVEAI